MKNTATKILSLLEQSHMIVEILKGIDEEATPVETDYPTGLWWYPGHLDRDGKTRAKNNTELCWTMEIAKRLQGYGYSATAEQCYPGASQRCDIVWEVAPGQRTWVEVKGAWRSVFDRNQPNTSYFKHLKGAADDIDKLRLLNNSDASAIIWFWSVLISLRTSRLLMAI